MARPKTGSRSVIKRFTQSRMISCRQSLRCPAASHSDGDNYEPSMQQLRLSVTFSWYKPPSYVKNDWIDKVMRRALAPELKSALGPSKNPIGFARYAAILILGRSLHLRSSIGFRRHCRRHKSCPRRSAFNPSVAVSGIPSWTSFAFSELLEVIHVDVSSDRVRNLNKRHYQ